MNSIGKLSSTVDAKKIESLINKCIAYSNDQYQSDFGPLPDPIPYDNLIHLHCVICVKY